MTNYIYRRPGTLENEIKNNDPTVREKVYNLNKNIYVN